MNLSLLLEMSANAIPDRVALGSLDGGITYQELWDLSRGVAADLKLFSVGRVAYLGLNSEALPVSMFAAALADLPFAPLNYRLSDQQLRELLARTTPSVVITSEDFQSRALGIDGARVMLDKELRFRDHLVTSMSADESSSDEVAILLFTSGTTGEPKAATLRHSHLCSYIFSSVEFLSSSDDESILVSVPPYHIAGVATILSSVFAGRRIVYLPQFNPEEWVDVARRESVTNAMVVPTMLDRILDALDRLGTTLPALRHLAYGGGRMPAAVIERAMLALPQVDFVNAYGLTETSSTIAVLTPDDHRTALASEDPTIRGRLGSVGRPLPDLDVEIRGDDGESVVAGMSGEIWVRGEQVSGEYDGVVTDSTSDGWFATRDGGHLDAEGYLFVEGRLDDVIVRGGENISPGEIEDALNSHPAVAESAVIGVPDVEWGEAIAAFVVVRAGWQVTDQELADHVTSRLRSSRRPSQIEFVTGLPYGDTGKVLRRVLRQLISASGDRAN